MRQGQQNRRGRGRNRSKGQNPLTRSFESNGPDGVKIRGTPAHIAEKFISYARDALSSGDRVLAENYLQHAEHYNRIIMAYREQNALAPGEQVGANGQRPQNMGQGDYNDVGDDGDDENFDNGLDGFRQQSRFAAQPAEYEQPQPRVERQEHRNEPRGDGEGGGRRQQRSRPHRQRADRNNDRSNDRSNDRNNDRNNDRSNDRNAERGNFERNGDGQRPPQPQPQPQATSVNAAPDEQPSGNGRLSHDDQPEFLRRPVRRPRRDPNGHADQASEAAGSGDAAEETVE